MRTSRERTIMVTNPPALQWLCGAMMGLFGLIWGLDLAQNGFNATKTAVCLVVILLWGLVLLWTKMLSVTVNGSEIAVRKMFGLVRFRVDVSQVRRVHTLIIRYPKVRYTMYIRYVRTDEGNFKIRGTMPGSGKLINFLEANLPRECFTLRDLT